MKARRAWALYGTATRFALIEHSRNRLALVIALLFVPAWITAVHEIISTQQVAFHLSATDTWIDAPGNRINTINAVFNTVNAIAGFLMFSSTFNSARFDRRLVAAGYSPGLLIAAKLTSLMVSAALLAGYGTLAVCLNWRPEQPGALAVSVFAAALAYGGIGVLLGVVLKGELEGMFLVIMLSIVDATLQNPVINPDAGAGITAFLPAYGSMQSGVAAGFLDTSRLSYAAVEAVWFGGAVLAAAAMLALRSRDRRRGLLGSAWRRASPAGRGRCGPGSDPERPGRLSRVPEAGPGARPPR